MGIKICWGRESTMGPMSLLGIRNGLEFPIPRSQELRIKTPFSRLVKNAHPQTSRFLIVLIKSQKYKNKKKMKEKLSTPNRTERQHRNRQRHPRIVRQVL